MLEIEIQPIELFNEELAKFTYTKPVKLELEHSLVSISKWEAITKKAFLSTKDMTTKDILLYIKCMTINHKAVDSLVFENLPVEAILEIKRYIDDPFTATTIKNDPNSPTNRDIITAEIIYYWMITFGIPVDFQKWHINRLLTLINVFAAKNKKPKKMSRAEAAAFNTALNDERLKAMG